MQPKLESNVEEVLEGFEFSEKSIRRGFVKKVYGILFVQLLFTCGIISVFVFSNAAGKWIVANFVVFWLSLGLVLTMMLTMACFPMVRRRSPINYICLAMFTIGFAFVLAFFAAGYDAQYVLLSVALTAGVCLFISLLALFTKWDLTLKRTSLLMFLVVLLFFGITVSLFPGTLFMMIFCSLGVFIFSVYLMYDTQLMIGGNHRLAISPEEYVFAALNLFVDIMVIFVCVFKLITQIKL